MFKNLEDEKYKNLVIFLSDGKPSDESEKILNLTHYLDSKGIERARDNGNEYNRDNGIITAKVTEIKDDLIRIFVASF